MGEADLEEVVLSWTAQEISDDDLYRDKVHPPAPSIHPSFRPDDDSISPAGRAVSQAWPFSLSLSLPNLRARRTDPGPAMRACASALYQPFPVICIFLEPNPDVR